MSLPFPFPGGIQVLRVKPGHYWVLQAALTEEATEMLSTALELAARMTGFRGVSANLLAICQEVIGEWSAQAADGMRVPEGEET